MSGQTGIEAWPPHGGGTQQARPPANMEMMRMRMVMGGYSKHAPSAPGGVLRDADEALLKGVLELSVVQLPDGALHVVPGVKLSDTWEIGGMGREGWGRGAREKVACHVAVCRPGC